MSADPTVSLSWGLDVVVVPDTDPCVVRVTGRLGSVGAARLRAQVAASTWPAGHVRLDLSDVDYVSSAGLASLHEAAVAQRARGGSLTVDAASEPVRVALQMAGDIALGTDAQARTSELPSGAR